MPRPEFVQDAPPVAGLIGWGSFGHVAARHLIPPTYDINVYDPNPNPDRMEYLVRSHRINRVDNMFDAIETDAVFLAVPFPYDASLLRAIHRHMPEDTLLTDFSSRRKATDEEFWGIPNFIGSHPLYGENTISNGVRNKRVAITERRGPSSDAIYDFWFMPREMGGKGMIPVICTAEQHDYAMRELAIAHYIGEILQRLGYGQEPDLSRASDDPTTQLSTPSGKMLHQLAKNTSHSEKLFRLIESGELNDEVREEFRYTAEEVEKFLRSIDEADRDGLVSGSSERDDLQSTGTSRDAGALCSQ